MTRLFWGEGVLEKGYSRDARTDFDAKYVKRRGSAQESAFLGWSGASAPYKRWSKCTMKRGGRFLQKLRGKCVNYLFVCGQRGCHSSHYEVNAQPPAPSAPSQPVRSVPAPAMGTANPQSNWQRGSSQGERAPPANVTPRPQSN